MSTASLPLAVRTSSLVWLHRYACLLAGCTLVLVAAGGMVTSTNSGLAVPDWPTTYGHNMFTYPLSRMAGGIFYEHGHRLIASAVGLLTIGMAIWLTYADSRRSVRRLGWLALAVVILQGLLGGMTVLFQLPDPISIAHAGLAQIFFCLTVTLALVTSPTWLTPHRPVPHAPLAGRLMALTALVYLQILLGATMRHTGGGLAIPDFPLAFGQLVPPFWNQGIALHFAHRVGALVVLILVLANAAAVLQRLERQRQATIAAWLLVGLVITQVTLGAYVVLSGKHPIINTLHVATGASVLATSLVLTLLVSRTRSRVFTS